MKKRWLRVLLLAPSIITYGAIYSWSQHWSDGYLSHRYNSIDHLMALNWAIFPPMWIVAPFITSGYENGLQFRHHHGRFCGDRESFVYWNPCEKR